MNAALTGVAERATQAFAMVLRDAGVAVRPFLSQNDGTLMALERARRYPVLTIASGPTNSLRGAAWLSGRTDAIVVDVGGTTADIGALVAGFPRESAIAVDVGGVRTNFRMPDLVAVALGGGTVVRDGAEGVTLGPDSVGHRITTEGRVFGGGTTTLTDVAVAAGITRLGPQAERADGLDAALVRTALERAHRRMAEALDRVRTSATDVDVIAVGGGAFLVPDDLPGAREVVRPHHHEVANAVGAAMAEVSGTVDRVVRTDEGGGSGPCSTPSRTRARRRWRRAPIPTGSARSRSRRSRSATCRARRSGSGSARPAPSWMWPLRRRRGDDDRPLPRGHGPR